MLPWSPSGSSSVMNDLDGHIHWVPEILYLSPYKSTGLHFTQVQHNLLAPVLPWSAQRGKNASSARSLPANARLLPINTETLRPLIPYSLICLPLWAICRCIRHSFTDVHITDQALSIRCKGCHQRCCLDATSASLSQFLNCLYFFSQSLCGTLWWLNMVDGQNVSRTKLESKDFVPQGTKSPSPNSTMPYLGLRAVDWFLQYLVLSQAYSSAVIKSLGRYVILFEERIITGIAPIDSLGLSGFRLLLLAINIVAAAKHSWFVLRVTEEAQTLSSGTRQHLFQHYQPFPLTLLFHLSCLFTHWWDLE